LVPQDEKAGFDNAIEFDPDQDGEEDDEDDGELSRRLGSSLPPFLKSLWMIFREQHSMELMRFTIFVGCWFCVSYE